MQDITAHYSGVEYRIIAVQQCGEGGQEASVWLYSQVLGSTSTVSLKYTEVQYREVKY